MSKARLVACALLLAAVSFVPAQAQTGLKKWPVAQFLAPACRAIEASLRAFPPVPVKKATRYFTPAFPPGPNGELRGEDRYACLNMEGSCVVGEYLYNNPSERFRRNGVLFKFGKGNGVSDYNKTNALDPCRTLAADQSKSYYPAGTVIYIPAMKSKICPQTGRMVDGCFIVGDVGEGIKGERRFDVFTGECHRYAKTVNRSGKILKIYDCLDPANNQFVPRNGRDVFHMIHRDHPLARQLRGETDAFIRAGWQ